MNEDNWIDRGARLLIALIISIIVLAAMGFFSSCTRTVYVPVTSVQRDSIYLHTHSRDSIVVHDSVTITEKGDTVWLTRVRIEYRDRLHTDTAYIERRDTIAVPFPVERRLTVKERFYMGVGKVALPAAVGVLLVLLYSARRKL